MENIKKAFYRVSEVAEILGLGRSLTYRLVAEGKIRSVWIAGCRSRRVSAKHLQEFIDEQSQQPQ